MSVTMKKKATPVRTSKKAPNPQQRVREPTLEDIDMKKPGLHHAGRHYWITFTEHIGASDLVRRITLSKSEYQECAKDKRSLNRVLERIRENASHRIIE